MGGLREVKSVWSGKELLRLASKLSGREEVGCRVLKVVWSGRKQQCLGCKSRADVLLSCPKCLVGGGGEVALCVLEEEEGVN